MAKNAMPGREGPENPLESTDDGNIRCKVVLLQLTLVPTLEWADLSYIFQMA